jgi:hypothetical protein
MIEKLRNYINHDEPFGPIDAVDIDENDVEVMEALFEQHNRLYRELHKRPSIIIGRKGAGKTAYLKSVFFDKRYTFYTEINTPKVFTQVLNSIQLSSVS